MDVPSFPTPFVVERIRQLGYGTGPWPRARLVELWNETTADKLIRDAKRAGWLVSPDRGVYYIPAAADLMAVPWLRGTLREEFLLAQTYKAIGLRTWCLSLWCRQRDLDLGGPLFVTDLSTLASGDAEAEAGPPTLAALRDLSKRRAAAWSSLPGLESLILVPWMPAGDASTVRRELDLPDLSQAPFRLDAERERTGGAPRVARRRIIPFDVGADPKDPAWIVALLATLDIGRGNELAQRVAKGPPAMDRGAVERYANLQGRPERNEDWIESVERGPFPFTLVPAKIAASIGAQERARRADNVRRLVGERHAT